MIALKGLDGEFQMIKLGDILWTCESSIESQSLGDYDLIRPYQVKITHINISGPKWTLTSYKASRFDENGEIDDDANASVYCNRKQLFENQEDALKYYKSGISMEIDYLERKILHLKSELEI